MKRIQLYFGQTVFAGSHVDEEAQVDLRSNKNLGVYKGALYENVVGEALVNQVTGCIIINGTILHWSRIFLSGQQMR